MRVLVIVACLVSALPALAAEPVKIGIHWEYRNFGEAVEIFEVEGRPRLWETKSVETLKDAPVANRIEGSSFTLVPGRRKRFVLIVRNDTSEALYFFAAPHVVDPVEHAIGFKFKCLCVNHAFTAGPGEVWYRVVEFRLSGDFVGDAMTVTHSIIGIDAKRAEAFSNRQALPDF